MFGLPGVQTMKTLILITALIIPVIASADYNNSQYWQMERNMQHRQIINEMQNMRREQERANRQAEMQYWNQQNQQRQQNIWHNWPQPQPQFYQIQPIRKFGQ